MKHYSSVAYQGSPGRGGVYNHLSEEYEEFINHNNDRKRKACEAREKRAREGMPGRSKPNLDSFFTEFFDEQMPQSYDDCSDKLDYPFSVFGLKRSSSADDVKSAYRKLILKIHPDKSGYDSNKEFQLVREAYVHYTDNY